MLDVVFIVPNNSKNIYQGLSTKYSAIETPTWALLLAQSCRSKNFKVSILDTNAENLDDKTSLEKIKQLKPKLNNSTCLMGSFILICNSQTKYQR